MIVRLTACIKRARKVDFMFWLELLVAITIGGLVAHWTTSYIANAGRAADAAERMATAAEKAAKNNKKEEN